MSVSTPLNLDTAGIRLCQLEVLPGRPVDNGDTMLEYIDQAKTDGINLLIFSEMCLPGYFLGDEWERISFLKECEAQGERIRDASNGLCIIFGNVAIDWQKINEDGRVRKYNAVFVAQDKQFTHNTVTGLPYAIKVLMPNYREFDDNRHFYDPRKLAAELSVPLADIIEPIPTQIGKLGCVLCEDGWDDDYSVSPLQILASKGADILINLSSSPYTHHKNQKRHRVFSAHAKQYGLPLLYVNNTGVQDNGKTVFTFDGATCAYDRSGNLLHLSPAFTAKTLDVSDSVGQQNIPVLHDGIDVLYKAIQYGTQKFMNRLGIKKVVIGVSGGIDSAVVAALYRAILPPENLLLVSMPGPFTSTTTKHLARQLANNLQCYFQEIPIEAAVALTQIQLDQLAFSKGDDQTDTLSLSVSDFVMENIQARDRSARILAGVAAAFGGVFTCNANKSEITVGYSTLYGDLSGYLANIADLWKGEVYQMAAFLNNTVYGREVIPKGIIDIVPSAELSANQNVDLNQGDPLNYPYHDALFRSWVERWDRATPEDILTWQLAGTLPKELNITATANDLFPSAHAFIDDLEHWWKQYQGMAIAKRIQAPPILAVKRRAFGFDHREAQLGARWTQKYLALKNQLLSASHW